MTDAGKKSQPLYLDLDAVQPDREVVVNFKGEKHKLQPITLDDFTKNLQMIRSQDKDDVKELQYLRDMLSRAFPTMGEHIGALTLPQLNKLFEFAMANNGGTESTEEAKAEAKENPSTAGQ